MSLLADLPDVVSLLLWGLVATMIMTIIMYGSQRAGLSRLSLPFLLGTCLTADRDWAHGLGFVAYLIGGWVFAVIYALLFAAVGTAWWIGAIAGFVHGAFLLLVRAWRRNTKARPTSAAWSRRDSSGSTTAT